MEHQCHHCSCVLEEGVPFCPRCGAPQIRVVSQAGEQQDVPGTPSELQTPQAVYQETSWKAGIPPQYANLRSGSGIHWRAALPAAAISGVVSGIVSSLIGALAIVLIPLAGLTTVQMYRRRTADDVTAGMGAKLGGFCGLFAFLVVAASVVFVFTLQPSLIHDLLTAQMASRPLDANQTAIMRRLIDSPEGLAVLCIAVLVFLFPVVLVLAVVGGALGAAFSGKHPHA